MCDHPIYCDACGDCIVCYGEDPCYFTDDGEHIPQQDYEKEDGTLDEHGTIVESKIIPVGNKIILPKVGKLN